MRVLIQGGEIQTALPVVQSLGRHGFEVVVGAKYKKTISFYSRFCKKHFQYPCPKNSPDEFIQCMLSKVRQEHYDVLISLGNEGMMELSKHRDLFLPYVKIPLVNDEALVKASSKTETLKAAIGNNIPCPKTWFVRNTDDVKKILDEIPIPAVLKPSQGEGSKGLQYINARDELVDIFEKTTKQFGEVIIQELIPPGGDTYGFEGIFNTKSEFVAGIVHKRLREFPITGGPSTFRISVDNPEIRTLGTRLLRSLGWYGIAMAEFKVDPRDNIPKLMEINPRFWGSLSLSIASGVDIPYLLCRLAVDGDIPPVPGYKKGVKARHLFYQDIKFLLAVMKGQTTPWGFQSPGRWKTLREFMNFFERDTVYDYLSRDDPIPGILRIISPVFRPYT